MPTLSDIKKDREFYRDFYLLVEALKAAAVLHFQTLQKKIKIFKEITESIELFFNLLDMEVMEHPFVQPKDRPMGIVAVTSDAGLLGGLNNKVMMIALNHLEEKTARLIVIGTQGQSFAKGSDVLFKGFPGISDETKFKQAQDLRDYIIAEVLNQRLGSVKIIYPYARTIAHHEIIEADILPCGAWAKAGAEVKTMGPKDIIMESAPGDMIEYLASLWIGQKVHEIFQFSHLAEYAARVVHLEDCSQTIKDLQKKLQFQYFRARREVIDQQMRELFAARI